MLRNAMAVLALFSGERTSLGVVEAATLLDRPKSTLSRWLAAMEVAGFLERSDEHGRYHLSMRLAVLGEAARRATPLQRVALAALERLTAATGETSNLVVLSGDAAVNVLVVESPRPLKHVGWLGRRLPLHATAAGKALLAWRKGEDSARLLRGRLARHAGHTIVDASHLRAELALTRRRGYATAWGELEDDLAAVAAPVLGHAGQVLGAITISAPVSRVPRRALKALAPPVQDAARATSAAMGWSGDAVRSMHDRRS
jgi:IclR family transcriptional regulator, acetate operon repressor